MPALPWRDHLVAATALNPTLARWPVAAKAGATMLLLLGGAHLAGQLGFALLASLGAFTVLYGPTTPARFRLRLMAAIGAGLVLAATVGSLTGGAPWLEVAALTVTAAVATFLCAALRIGPPGAFFFVLVQGVGGLAAAHGTNPGQIAAAAAVGAIVALAVGMADLIADPDGPERRAVEAAEGAMTAYEEAWDPGELAGVRFVASQSLHSAWTVVTDAGSAPRWTTRLWAVQDRYAAASARVADVELATHPAPWGSAGGAEGIADEWSEDVRDGGRARTAGTLAEQIRDTSLGRPRAVTVLAQAARWPSHELLVVGRVALAALLAGALAVAVGNGHLYWAMAFATLVLHQGGTRRAQTVRAIQRCCGTALGLGVFAVVAWAAPAGWWLVAVIAALQFVVEILIAVNYGLAVIAITPLALTIGAQAGGGPAPGELVRDRAIDTVIGVTIALVVLHGLWRAAAVPMLRAYARRVVHGIDGVLADLGTGRLESRDGRERRRALYHALLESEEVAGRAATDDPGRAAPYREMERTLSHLGYLVLGMAWHPDARNARTLAESARDPLDALLAHPVTRRRAATDIHADVRALGDVIRGWRPGR